MALPVQSPQTKAPDVEAATLALVGWPVAYYSAEAAANITAAPKLGGLEQMYAYY